jgi:hypothetical protein
MYLSLKKTTAVLMAKEGTWFVDNCRPRIAIIRPLLCQCPSCGNWRRQLASFSDTEFRHTLDSLSVNGQCWYVALAPFTNGATRKDYKSIKPRTVLLARKRIKARLQTEVVEVPPSYGRRRPGLGCHGISLCRCFLFSLTAARVI